MTSARNLIEEPGPLEERTLFFIAPLGTSDSYLNRLSMLGYQEVTGLETLPDFIDA